MSNLMLINNKNSLQTKLDYKFTCPFMNCLTENNIKVNVYIGHTSTTLSRRLTNYHSNISAIKQHLKTKHN